LPPLAARGDARRGNGESAAEYANGRTRDCVHGRRPGHRRGHPLILFEARSSGEVELPAWPAWPSRGEFEIHGPFYSDPAPRVARATAEAAARFEAVNTTPGFMDVPKISAHASPGLQQRQIGGIADAGRPLLDSEAAPVTCARAHSNMRASPVAVTHGFVWRACAHRVSTAQRRVGHIAANANKGSEPPPPSPPQGRVTKDSPLSVRKQISLLRAYKAQSTSSPKPKVRTRFRRKRETTADGAADAASADEGAALSKQRSDQLPLLLVDGYNVIGYWPRLKKRRDKGDMAGARDLLLDDLVEYNSPKQYDVVVVFDAVGSNEKVDFYFGIAVVYTPSADAYIESETRRLVEDAQRDVVAATADTAIQVAAVTHGARVMSTHGLVQELKASRAGKAAFVEAWNRREDRLAPAGTFFDALDESTKREWDSAIKAAARASLSKAEREALAAKEAMKQEIEKKMRKPALPPRKAKHKVEMKKESVLPPKPKGKDGKGTKSR